MSAPSTPVRVARFGVFEADFQAGELRKAGLRIKLQDQPLQILAMLLAHPGELVTRENIRERLWPADTFVDFDHGLNNAVNRLREALGDSADSPHWIETLPRRGYRFIGTTNGGESAKTANVSEAQPKKGELKDDAIDAVSAQSAGLPKGRSYRWLVLAAPVTALALALLVTFALLKSPVPPSSRSFVLPPDGTTFNLIGDSGGSPVLTADGTKLAFVAVDAKGTPLIWVRPLGKLSADPIDDTQGATFPFWSPDGRSIGFFADGKLKKVSLEGGRAVAVCDAPFGRGGSWNRDGVIIFAPASHTGIYKVPDSGGVPTPITNVDTSIHTTHRWPKFLPDGKHFIYLAASHFHDASHNGVYFSSLDGKENKTLVPAGADATYASGYLFFLRRDVLMAQSFDSKRGQLQGEPRPTVERVLYDPIIWKAIFDTSQNGVMAYQLGDTVSGTQLRWVDRSGRQLGTIGEPRFQWDPRLSRDGRKLAIQVSSGSYVYGNLWVLDLDRGVRMQITSPKFDSTSPIWSLDGTQIFYGGKRQHYSLYQANSSGAGQERLILDTGSDTWPLDLSPDSRFLLYGQGLNIGRLQSQLWVYPMSGNGSPFRLLEGEAVEADGQFSPDGRWVAYSSNESGRDEVYVIPFHRPSTSSERRNAAVSSKWQISLAGGHQPRWRRDGRELFYLAADNTLVAIPVTSRGSMFKIGGPHSLFRANPLLQTYNFYYDVSSDGRRFVINTAAQERTAPITLVENWPSDFRK
jgi:DNA-binding winged helix-turn-helix (wHTH) protein/Tol biopolymer transport system component